MSEMFLTREEVADLTGRKVKKKQIEHLRTLGIVFWINALGVPVVPRSAIEGRRDTPKPAERERVVPYIFRTGADAIPSPFPKRRGK